jgi:hypothetical protein
MFLITYERKMDNTHYKFYKIRKVMKKRLDKYINECIKDPKYKETYKQNYNYCNDLFNTIRKKYKLKCKFSTYNTFEEEHADGNEYEIRINNLVLLSKNFTIQKLENIVCHEMAHHIVDSKYKHDENHLAKLNDDELEEYYHKDPRWRQKFVEINPRFTCDKDIDNDEWVDFDEEFNKENLKKSLIL